MAELVAIGLILMGLSIVLRQEPFVLFRPFSRWGKGVLGRTIQEFNRLVYRVLRLPGQLLLQLAERAHYQGGWGYILLAILIGGIGRLLLLVPGVWNFLFPSRSRRGRRGH